MNVSFWNLYNMASSDCLDVILFGENRFISYVTNDSQKSRKSGPIIIGRFKKKMSRSINSTNSRIGGWDLLSSHKITCGSVMTCRQGKLYMGVNMGNPIYEILKIAKKFNSIPIHLQLVRLMWWISISTILPSFVRIFILLTASLLLNINCTIVFIQCVKINQCKKYLLQLTTSESKFHILQMICNIRTVQS